MSITFIKPINENGMVCKKSSNESIFYNCINSTRSDDFTKTSSLYSFGIGVKILPISTGFRNFPDEFKLSEYCKL